MQYLSLYFKEKEKNHLERHPCVIIHVMCAAFIIFILILAFIIASPKLALLIVLRRIASDSCHPNISTNFRALEKWKSQNMLK